MKIWFRVGMEADITVEELEKLMCRIVIIMKAYMKMVKTT